MKEYAAFHMMDNIIWLGYYWQNPKKGDRAYTMGWGSDKTGAARYSELRKVLDAQFGFDRQRPFLARNGRICGIGSDFIGCTQVFLDNTIPPGIKAVLMSWFLEYGVALVEVEAPWQSVGTINEQWLEPMGDPFPADPSPEELGQARALSVMDAGLKKLAEQPENASPENDEHERPRAYAATAKPSKD